MKKVTFMLLVLVVALAMAGCSRDDLAAPGATGSEVIRDNDGSPDKGRGHANPGIIPPNARPKGKSYAEWSAAWWQWLWSAPADVNPGLDTDGSFVTYGQSGSVWFIAPNYGGGQSDIRHATIPTGKMLFVDVVGVFTAFELEPDPEIDTIEELRQLLTETVDTIEEIVFMVDGTPLQNVEDYRVASTVFEYTLPDNNMFQLFGFDTPAGTYYPAVAEGYYVMLTPLSAGEHTIYIFADLGPVFGTSEVTLHLTVSGNAQLELD